jgi:hypothetical protein
MKAYGGTIKVAIEGNTYLWGERPACRAVGNVLCEQERLGRLLKGASMALSIGLMGVKL